MTGRVYDQDIQTVGKAGTYSHGLKATTYRRLFSASQILLLCWCLGGGLLLAAGFQVTDDAASIAQRALELQQAGDDAAAVDAYRSFLKLHPNEAGARSNLGAALVKLGRYHEAIEEYQKAEKLLPGDARIGMNLALAYEKSGRVREASQKLAALHAQAPQEKQITLLLADCELQLADYDRVIKLLKPVEREDPADLGVAYMLSTAFIRTRRTADGQALLDQITHNGASAEARFLLGTQQFESGNYPAAVKELASAIELNPRLPQLQSYYGLALLNTGDPVAAAAAFRHELADNPDDYASNLALGQILIAAKKYAEAMPFAEAALRSNPESVDAKLAVGECLSGAGKLREARERLEAVTQATPDSLEAHRELLSVCTRLQLGPEAARERATVNRLERAAAEKAGGPPLNALAPDFDLPEVGAERGVRLSDLRGKSPAVLVFGSYSCPNFRASAAALNSLYQRYGGEARFFLVYIREAHASGQWQSTRNEREGIDVLPALTMEDKEGHATMCMRRLHLKFPALVDGMDRRVETAYAAWPSRAFVIGADGRVLYVTGLSQLDFHAEAMEAAVRSAIANQSLASK